jgi:hypothetical protein
MKQKILDHIVSVFDRPVMQNNLRAMWVEIMTAELLGDCWRHTGADWAAWDLEHQDGTRLEVKQSARDQTWGRSTGMPRFGIAAATGHYPDGVNFEANTSGARLADIYVLAWHEGDDQRIREQWQFFVMKSSDLPAGHKSIGLSVLRGMTEAVASCDLRSAVERIRSEELARAHSSIRSGPNPDGKMA